MWGREACGQTLNSRGAVEGLRKARKNKRVGVVQGRMTVCKCGIR